MSSLSPLALPLSDKARRTVDQPISFLITTALKNPQLINFAAGLVDPATLPVRETRTIAERILSDVPRGRSALQYDTTVGLAGLRTEAVAHIERLEHKHAGSMGLTADDILVTTGSQQALYLIGDVLINPDDIVIAANPCYFVYTGTLASLGAKVHTVPMDDNGMDVTAVDALLARIERDGDLDKVKLIYCTSYFQNPTGLTLSAERRPVLLEIAKKYSKHHRILILEDAAYRELRYDGPALPSIKSYDTANQFVVLSQTFSKPFAPGLKLGYSAMPHDLLHAVAQQKGNHDFGSANLTQHIAMESLKDGSYIEHGNTLRDAYRRKRDAMVKALDANLPKAEGIRRTDPHGGLYVWLTLPNTFDTSRTGTMFKTAVERGVLYVPGDYCFQPDEQTGRIPTNHLRLSFGQVSFDQIEPGIRILCEVIADMLPADAPSTAGKPQSVPA